jgi:phosphatidylglycerol:prolipoprotein diacylglycerol transferase
MNLLTTSGYLFPTLVGLAIFVGLELAVRRGKRIGLDTRALIDGSLWTLISGFFLSHLFFIVLYHPQMMMDNPMVLLRFWGGMSSYGGFWGGVLGGLLYLKIKRVPMIPYCETALFGFVPAWILGRLGCTITFDHPGTPTDFFLSMTDKAGVVRHNLGFYEMLWTIVITVVLYGLRNYRPFEGFHAVLVIFMYAPVRFFLDSLRVSDPLYWGFTPGQYFSVALFLLGVFLLIRGLKKRSEPLLASAQL